MRSARRKAAAFTRQHKHRINAYRLQCFERDFKLDVTDSPHLSRVFRFYSTDGTSGRYYMSSQIFPFLCIGALALGFVGYVCSKKKILPPFPSQFHACTCFITIFIVYFLISRRISLVSSGEIAV
jgi:hypothetical protein